VIPPKKRLGRGLDGLLPPAPSQSAVRALTATIEQLHPDRNQPRKRFEDESLAELAKSISENGIVQPIVVRKRDGGGFTIIAGERRWRAAQRAGLHEVPIVVKELSDQAAFEIAIVENIQREDLSPIETARAYERLANDYGLKQDEIAEKVGKSRVTVTNAMRLLKLPAEILDMVEDEKLSEGHARALLGAGTGAIVDRLARTAHAKGWSVRELEKRVREEANGKASKSGAAKAVSEPDAKSANVRDLEKRYSHALGVAVSIEQGKGERGRICLEYGSYDELDRLLALLVR
jgi:ParB family chromosome partitioning protein